MITTMTLDQLLSLAASVGLELTVLEAEQTGPLYAWTTPEGEVVYIGKSASSKRYRDEATWANSDPTSELLSAFVALVRRNRATCRPLAFDGFDSSTARQCADGWSGGAFDALHEWLDDPRELSVEGAETLLIRIAVRCGVPIGNSKDASQWEGPLGTPVDTLAALAAVPLLGRDDVVAQVDGP